MDNLHHDKLIFIIEHCVLWSSLNRGSLTADPLHPDRIQDLYIIATQLPEVHLIDASVPNLLPDSARSREEEREAEGDREQQVHLRGRGRGPAAQPQQARHHRLTL